MAPGAVAKIKAAWEQVCGQGYAGLIGLDADMNTGKVIGKGFPALGKYAVPVLDKATDYGLYSLLLQQLDQP